MSYIRLKDQYKVREEDHETGILFDVRYEYIQSQVHRIPVLHLALLRLCGGDLKKEDMVRLYMNAFSKDVSESKAVIVDFLEYYSDYLEYIDEPNVREDILLLSKPGAKRSYTSLQRLKAPLSVSIVLTYQCNCQCVYCYANAAPDRDKQDQVTKDTLFRFLEEAREMGVNTIGFSGGEPFLHNDVIQLIEKSIQLGFETNVITKMILTRDEISKLKSVGLKYIQISYDTSNNNHSEEITGVKNYAVKMYDVISMLVEHGINVIVNCVITKINIGDIPKLVKDLTCAGVIKIMLNPYARTLGRHTDDLFPEKEDYEGLQQFFDSTPTLTKIEFAIPNFNRRKTVQEISRCTGGRMGLVVLPDGKVSMCERFLDDKNFIVGDITKQTLQQIWESDELFSIIEPERDKFIGTDCYSCEEFEFCVLDKGLCYFRCKAVYDQYYQKDPFCPKANNERFF